MTNPFKKLKEEIDRVENNLDSILTKDKKKEIEDALEEIRSFVEQIEIAHPDDLDKWNSLPDDNNSPGIQ